MAEVESRDGRGGKQERQRWKAGMAKVEISGSRYKKQ